MCLLDQNLHSSEYDKRIWRTSSGTIPRRGHDPDSFMRPTTGAKLFYSEAHTHTWECVAHDACSSSLCVPSPPPETMAQAPTDIGARLVSTPIKYNYMKTVYPRYPATKLKFQCVPLTQSITSAICICICLCYSVVQTAAGGTCSANYFGACLFVWLFRRQV